MKITSIKGMHDLGPPEIAIWHWVEKTAREVFETAGFSELRTPVLEEEALFTQSIGNTTEIVEKEMYRFPDRKGKILALRPEGTASVVRAFIEHYAAGGGTQRFYYSGPMFRYERPQKGRYRQFYQMGVEIFGSSHPLTDAESIHLADEIFRRLNLDGIMLRLNSLGCKNCRPEYRKALLDFLRPKAAELCEECQKRIERNPLRALDCKNEKCIEVTSGAPSVLDHLCEACRDHFEGVQKGLRSFGTAYEIHPRMVRGLDYYERTAFEFQSEALGSQNAVAGGGRYDDLVKDLGGPAVPGVGFAIGMERLVSLVSSRFPVGEGRQKIFFASLGDHAQTQMLLFLIALRREGFEVVTDYDAKSLKSLLRQADRLGADYAVIVGDEELKQGAVQVKEMKEKGEQKNIPLESLVLYFQSKKPKGRMVL
jgi:histidyl-tRNA synthetase